MSVNVDKPRLQLEKLLSPQGVITVTTGGSEMEQYIQRRYGATDPVMVRQKWMGQLDKIKQAKVCMIGVPMDAGAGFERGAFKGPLGIRSQLLSKEGLMDHLEVQGVIDLGDVFVNPQLVHEPMCSLSQIEDTYTHRGWGQVERSLNLPITPHGALERILEVLRVLNPLAKVLLLGGDHGFVWAPIRVLTRDDRNADHRLGIIHFDAHTDLLEKRDGIRWNFATWAYLANQMIGRGNRLQQLGVRVSGRTKDYWESTLELRQIRMDEIRGRSIKDITAEVVANFKAAGVSDVYISNDIDGTDPKYGAATGTMELDGMHPSLVLSVIKAAGLHFNVIGSDLVEVAPPLNNWINGEPKRTTKLAASYVWIQLEAMLQQSLGENPFLPLSSTSRDRLLRVPRYA